MSVKQVKIILLLLTVVIVSNSIIFLDTITSPTASAIDRPGVLPPLENADETPIGKPEQQQIFQVIPSISQSIRVPAVIRSIPQKIPRKISAIFGKVLNIKSPIYRVVTSPTSSKSEMLLGYAEDCYGGTACRLGMISAEKLTETATEPPGSEVSLEDGTIGHFVEGSCGANCSDSTISWDYRGSRYTLGIKVGKQETMVKMADVKLRKLVKGLQELLTGQERGSLIEKMAISDQLIDRRETGEDQSARKIDPTVKYFQKSQSSIANGVVWNYRESLLNASKQTLPKIGRYAVLRLSDGINYDEDEVVEDVRTLQDLLMKEGLLRPSELDGMFGPTTLKAVKEFQKSRGLVADGIVGQKTWSQLWNYPVEVYLPYDNLISSLYLDEIIESIPPEIRLYGWDSVPLILWECDRSGVTDFGQIAYILATAEHESRLGKWMVELGDFCQYYDGLPDLGNTRPGDGCRYKGRGFVQITGRRNYTDWSDRLGIDLVRFPEKAADPEIAAKILVRGMRDGTFTRDHWLSKYIRGRARDFYNARRIVNGLDRAPWIEAIAKEYYKVL